VKTLQTAGALRRWGWLLITLVLGLALIFTSIANYRSARNATNTLHVGQGQILESSVWSVLHGDPENVRQEDLETLLTERANEGLRYVALLDDQGRIVFSAGEPDAEPLVDPRHSSGRGGPGMVEVGSRVRMFISRRPLPTPISTAPEAEQELGRRPGGMILEFEPVVASQLIQRAARSLGFGFAAAVSMMLAAAVFWVMSLRYEQARRRLEDERRLSVIGEMSAVLAHEIRNPLTSLKGHAQLLAEQLSEESSERRKADRVIMEVTRLEALTADLLDFVRSGPLELTQVDPAELLQASAEEVDAQDFDLELKASPESWPLDARRLRQALTNLLRNARQASPQGARPVARVSTENGRLIFTVRDFGEGLPKGQEDRVFDPFFTTKTSGTGLGLSVARRIAELHGGSLTAQNHPQGGAVFRIELPERKG
jgi:two-component system sensor histidine kinase HydH